MLTKDQKYKYRHTLDLRKWGFEQPSDYEYKNEHFLSVIFYEDSVVFSCKQFTRSVQYDKVEEFLLSKGFKKIR